MRWDRTASTEQEFRRGLKATCNYYQPKRNSTMRQIDRYCDSSDPSSQ